MTFIFALYGCCSIFLKDKHSPLPGVTFVSGLWQLSSGTAPCLGAPGLIWTSPHHQNTVPREEDIINPVSEATNPVTDSRHGENINSNQSTDGLSSPLFPGLKSQQIIKHIFPSLLIFHSGSEFCWRLSWSETREIIYNCVPQCLQCLQLSSMSLDIGMINIQISK